MLLIRNIKEDDKDIILELGKKIFREEDEIPLLKKALFLCISDLSFVAINNNTIVGFTLVCQKATNIYYNFLRDIPNCYELAFLGISPDSQGCGLGTRLLKETLLAIFQKSDKFTCWLLVDTINTGAISLYKKFGFRQWVSTKEITSVPGYIMGISHRRFTVKSKIDVIHTVKTIMCQ